MNNINQINCKNIAKIKKLDDENKQIKINGEMEKRAYQKH